MNKKSATFSLVLLLLLTVTTPASALEVIIDSSGQMTFYTDGVLGDSIEVEKTEQKTREMQARHEQELREQKSGDAETIKRRQELEKNQLKRELETKRKKEIETVAKEKKQQPIKVVSPKEEKELRIKQEKEELRVEVREKESDELIETDQANPERLRVELMATPREDLTPEQLDEIGSRNARQRLEERKERIGEVIELRRSENDSEDRLELKSREVIAKIQQSAEINIDPDTNELSVIAPNGEVVKVIHLPDQALTRLENLGNLENVDGNAEKRLELVTSEDGKVIYKLTVPKRRKLFGLFDRQIETEVELDDETGLSTETPVKRGGFIGFLDSLSF